MAHEIQLPCDGEGVCMRCKMTCEREQTITCTTCATPWHMSCLLPESLISPSSGYLEWLCPDCSGDIDPVFVSGVHGFESSVSDLIAAICAIETDASLTEEMKAKKRQKLMSGKDDNGLDENEKNRKGKNKVVNDDEDMLDSVREIYKCPICLELLEKPITTPCGHNLCLNCFEKWIGKGNFNCVQCRGSVSKTDAKYVRINLALVAAIRSAKNLKRAAIPTLKVQQHHIQNEDLPEKGAVENELTNASSSKIKVHFGLITAENDLTMNQESFVGKSWGNMQECKKLVGHFQHISGIGGQANYGDQAVIISRGYKKNEDHGEWFVYTASGGRDLSDDEKTKNKLEKSNEALRISCKMGYPVKVFRSFKARRSAYAPVDGLRYDGVYRIEMCCRKLKSRRIVVACSCLFVRCDNEAAPWTSNEHGDRPRPVPQIPQLNKATDYFVREESPSWDFDKTDGRWKWMKPSPASRMLAENHTIRERLLKLDTEFSCQICQKVMSLPVTTPCGHNFCKACLGAKFDGIAHVRDTLCVNNNIMICPSCPMDIADFLQNPQVNREMVYVIEKLTKKEDEENSKKTTEANSGGNTDSKEEEEEEKDEEEFEIDVSEAEEASSKRMKLDQAVATPSE